VPVCGSLKREAGSELLFEIPTNTTPAVMIEGLIALMIEWES
jgi:hypothetical protein